MKVRILLDWLGSRGMDTALLDSTKAAGCEVELYHKLTWYHLGRLNNRTHRKLLVVDGRIGFTGGVGMGNEWEGNAQDPQHWRENHYRVEGPVVAQMQAVFVDNWIKATGRVLHGPEYFPDNPPLEAAAMDAQMFGSSPVGAAARRGVRVRIVVPGKHSDTRLGRWAAHALYGQLLEAGAEIFEYQPTMIHTKLMVVDATWTSVGSANFDERSFRLNDEANLNVFSNSLAREQTEQIDRDIAHSKKMVLSRWMRRSGTRRIYEQLGLLMRSQL